MTDSTTDVRDCEGRPTPLIDTVSAAFASDDPSAPRVRNSQNARYPADLRRSRIAGRVVVNYTVDAEGAVVRGSIAVLFATRPAFRVAVCTALGKTRYEPLIVAGKRQSFRIVQRIFDFRVRIIRPNAHGSA
ncbi:MAG: TonB family protein [Gemmatimonadaceae bacterium]